MIATALALALGAGTAVGARTGVISFGDSCEGGTVELRIAASPDVAPALSAVAASAKDSEAKSDGRCLDVQVSERTGSEVADTLQRGERLENDIWVPDSKVWLDRAGSSGKAPALETVGNVAGSPLALAAIPTAAGKLGWPRKSYTWSRIADAAAGDDEPRVGTADPARSATGLLALARIQQATAEEEGRDSDTKAAAAAKLLAKRTAAGNAQALQTLPHDRSAAERGNPQRNHALILSEQAAFAHNKRGGDAPRLRLFYPKGGATALDYPYTLVDAKKLGTEKSRAALRFQTLIGNAEGRRTLAAHGFRPASGQAQSGVTRTAGGRDPQPFDAAPAPAPSARNVRSTLGMWTITVQSARFLMVVDASASMAAPVRGRSGASRMDVTKESLAEGLSQFTAQDEVGLWEFSTKLDGKRDYRELVPTGSLDDRDGRGRTRRDRLTAAFGSMAPIPDGATGLHDTTLAAYKKARDGYAEGRFNAVVLLTDGANEDPGSIDRDELTAELDELSDGRPLLPIIGVAVGPDADEKGAQEIAEATGGSAHQVDDPAQIHSVILKAVMEAGSRS
ncbi:VWA domain-containing protein [Streptomyces sp. SB3404]|uniref:VWA domain-containing protein n=1 Tax=Streptomyces boncukensis TaxID=2711219 RepID=A0A6G4X185_9ACTN|nr:VWA domain-containing protein [Streptomyces boncukensis]